MNQDLLVYYKLFRIGLLVGGLYFIIWYLYFTKHGKNMEEVARKILEEDDQ